MCGIRTDIAIASCMLSLAQVTCQRSMIYILVGVVVVVVVVVVLVLLMLLID